ncbi:MAG: type IV-A pilus assembly ATPase PilB [Elusimicrobia bacterium RIFOXYB2_FULL_48_7]|nr:MAG: type IV-A pilus assembly ATPase PilB [Elusimicrobia bacterium RIFOXYB2_FULL_48_7]
MPRQDVIPLKKLGEMFVNLGILTQEQLKEALEIQRQSGGKLGNILMQLGYITEEVLLTFLGKQAGMQFISLQEFGEIPEEVLKAVPESVIRHQTLIPIEKKGKTLTIAMSDPFNIFAIDDLKVMTGFDINVVISSEKEIKDTIEKYYTAKGSMETVLKDIEAATEGEDTDLEVMKEQEQQTDNLSLEAMAEEAPVVKIVNFILSNAVKQKASDIHVEPYEKTLRVRFRIDGVLHEQQPPPKRMQNAIISRLKIMANLDIAEHRLPQDGRIKVKIMDKEISFRVSVLPMVNGEKIVLRILDSSSLRVDLNKLGLEPESMAIFEKNIQLPFGINLVTGPTGSGKTTTLYSALSTLNHPDINISTIEDPVEFMIEGINQVHVRADIGLTFAAGLRSFLRQDPNIILVGEIRDKETGEIAINAALTGHLVFATLHTNDAPSTITRLSNMGVEPFLTTSTVAMIISQRLLRTICKNCKEPYEVPIEHLIPLGVKPEQVGNNKNVVLYKGRGCDKCSKGYKGRLGAYEILEMCDEIRELILNREPTHIVKQVARKKGMMTLRESALRKLLGGLTTVEEVLRVTTGDTAIETV